MSFSIVFLDRCFFALKSSEARISNILDADLRSCLSAKLERVNVFVVALLIALQMLILQLGEGIIAEVHIPIPIRLLAALREAKQASTSEFVISNRDGDPLSYTQFKRLWTYIKTRTVKDRTYYRYVDGVRKAFVVHPKLGEKASRNGRVVYSLDFEVTPHQLRHTYITNLIHAGVDPKTVQYLAGHENSKITMDIYAKVKYNRPADVAPILSDVFSQWNKTG